MLRLVRESRLAYLIGSRSGKKGRRKDASSGLKHDRGGCRTSSSRQCATSAAAVVREKIYKEAVGDKVQQDSGRSDDIGDVYIGEITMGLAALI